MGSRNSSRSCTVAQWKFYSNCEIIMAEANSSHGTVVSGYSRDSDCLLRNTFVVIPILLCGGIIMNPAYNKPEHFQVCITVLEARHLAWPTMNPVVCVEVDDDSKYTSTKQSTDCPFYNEYFVFDFHLPFPLFLEKVIKLTVFNSHGLGRRQKALGKVQFDVATVWKQPDHQFYHKWAMLQDHQDLSGNIKGYLKCDITAIGKGDVIKVHPPGAERDDDDIEGNLLVPEGVTSRMQRARYMIHVYRAEIVTEGKDKVDPYVNVSFAGLKGRTSTKTNTNSPVWNEAIDFSDSFPPLWQRIKVQICDSNIGRNNVIATHLLDLPTISSDRDTVGFLPTFGPSFLYLYGAANPRSGSPRVRPESWVAVLGDGAAYRGRLLLGVETELLEAGETLKGSPKRGVAVRTVEEFSEQDNWKMEEFLLVGVVWEVSMLGPKLKNKSVHVEVSLGSKGNLGLGRLEPSEGKDTPVVRKPVSDLSKRNPNPKAVSTTVPQQPEIREEKAYCCLPYPDRKPCVFVHSYWPDTRHRMFHSNLLEHLAHRLSLNLTRTKLNEVEDDMEKHVRDILEDLIAGCSRYLLLTGTLYSNFNRLDRMRYRLCRNEVEKIVSSALKLEGTLSRNSVEITLIELQDILRKLDFLKNDPQHSLPDVFVWLVVDEKRIAFHRAPARHFMFSVVNEEKGKKCGHLQTILMKAPAKAGEMVRDDAILPAKIDLALWLGRSKHSHICFESLPMGFKILSGFGPQLSHSEHPILPRDIQYIEKHKFEFRAYIHQGRLKPGADSTALADSFVRIVVGGWNRDTQIEKAELTPTWEQTLLINEIWFPGTGSALKAQPPVIIIEVYDLDKSALKTKNELVGRTTAVPSMKLADEEYTNDDYKPCLHWYKIQLGTKVTGEVLAAFELLEVSQTLNGPKLPEEVKGKHVLYRLPEEIKPEIVGFRIEVLFWGLRNMKKLNVFNVKKPQVTFECRDIEVHSTALADLKKNPNFTQPLQFLQLELPVETVYHPPVSFIVKDLHTFGRSKYVGTHIQHSTCKFLLQLDTKQARAAKLQSMEFPQGLPSNKSGYEDSLQNFGIETTPLLLKTGSNLKSITRYDSTKKYAKKKLKKILHPLSKTDDDDIDAYEEENKGLKSVFKKRKILPVEEDDESFDWWAKYYSSLQTPEEDPCVILEELVTSISQPKDDKKNENKLEKITLKIYPTELESQPEFSGFNDFLNSFEIYRGKTTWDEMLDRENIVGTLKGTIRLYRWPPAKGIELVTASGLNVADGGVLQDMPTNDPIRIYVRVYVVRASSLHSKDLSGKSDPYLVLELGKIVINDKENYVPHQLNPIFGRYFEIEAVLPMDYLLTVRIMDNDIAAADDLIGETKIDLENRFYSKHRATCGIPSYYQKNGWNKWRDSLKPSDILEDLCRKHRINTPVYSNDKVTLGGTDRIEPIEIYGEAKVEVEEDLEEVYLHEMLALYALHQWHKVPHIGYHLVPEHVETRSLFHPDKPGIEQGKVELWVDMFPAGGLPPPPPVDIAPRKPVDYELRVIVWNTEDVILQEDSLISGEKMSDIYVKGWLVGKEDLQHTDVHYRSLTGEGNFNWRFVFKFSYLSAEDKIVTTKESIFTHEVTETKSPCRLNLQVFDNDTFSKDDFLGALVMDLASMPRGARVAKHCKLNLLDKNSPQMNLFKITRTKGWWPFKAPEGDTVVLTGKAELEFQLVTAEEAEKNPVGLGRSEPEPLPPPKRPETSFLWFKNPLRSFKYIFWRQYKWCLCRTLCYIVIFVFIGLAIYSIPGYSIKRLMGA